MRISCVLVFALVCIALTASYVGAEEKSHSVEKHQANAGGSSAEAAGGKHIQGKKYAEHGGGKKSGKKSKHFNEKIKHGEKLSEVHKVEDEESGGKKHKHHDEGHHAKSHQEKGGSQHGAGYAEGEHHNKGNFERGFNQKWHKDEFKKHDSFFSIGEQAGNYNVFGKKGAKHGSKLVTKAAGGTFKNLKTEGKHGKKSKKVGGHNKSSKKAHKGTGGSKTHHENNKKYARKGGKKGGKQYKHKKEEKPQPEQKA